jgi:hypothetical protein
MQPETSKPFFGTLWKKLARRGDPDTSNEAAQAVDTTRLEALVYEAIRSFGDQGCISDDVRALFPGLPYSSVTARYKALIDKGYIEDTGARREGGSGRSQRVLRATKETTTKEMT